MRRKQKYEALMGQFAKDVTTAPLGALHDMVDAAAERIDVRLSGFGRYLLGQLESDALRYRMVELYLKEAYDLDCTTKKIS